MAIIFNGTQNLLPAVQVPAAYTRPNVTTFDDHEYFRELTLDVLKATVENAAPAVTMANILNDAAIGIDKQLSDILAADFLGTATVEAYAKFSVLRTNYSDIDAGGDYLKVAAPKYICAIQLFAKTI